MLKSKYIGMLVIGILVIFSIILLAKTTDAQTEDDWTNDIRLTNNRMVSMYPRLGLNGDHLYIVWQDDRDNNWEIYFKESSDAGENWDSDVRLTTNDGEISQSPALNVYGSNVFVVWSDNRDGVYEIYFKKGTKDDWGNQKILWGSSEKITSTGSDSISPSITVLRNDIYVVWSENVNDNWEIYFKHGDDSSNEIKWDDEIRVTDNIGKSDNPDIAVIYDSADANYVYIVWDDNRTGNYEIHFIYSDDNGENWQESEKLSNGNNDSFDPRISVNSLGATIDQYLHVTWWDSRHKDEEKENEKENWEIYYIRGKHKGEWEKEQRVTSSSYASEHPSIVVDDSYIRIAWQDYRTGNYEIYYIMGKNSNNGVTWGFDEQLTNNAALSGLPDIAIYSDKIHIVWHDDRDALLDINHEIYYKRSPDFEPAEDPIITINTPRGGEEWSGDNTIQWLTENFNGDTTYTIKLSIDEGETWDILTEVIYNENGNAIYRSWTFDTTTRDDNNTCLINITGDNGTHQASDQNLNNFTIDNTPPITTDELTDDWRSNNYVYLNRDDGEIGSGFDVSGTTYYKIDDDDYVEGDSFTIDDSGEHTIKYYSIDDAGNEEEENSVNGKFDFEIPIFYSWNIPEVNVDSTDLEVSIEVEDQDELSGMNESKIKMSYVVSKETNKDKIKSTDWDDNETNGNLDGSDAKLEIDINMGDFENYYLYVKCKAYDIAGNHNESISDGNLIIDNTPPYIRIMQPKSGDAFGDEVEIIFKALNTTSDFNITYKPRIGDWQNVGIFKNSDMVGDIGTYLWNTSVENVEENYDYKIRVEEIDGKAWNESKMFVIDHSAPDSRPDIKTYWMNNDLDITLDPYDSPILNQREPSGVNRTYYRIDEGEWIVKYGGKIKFTISDEGEQKIEFYSVDNASNIEEIRNETVKIDKAPPTIGNWNIPDITYVSDSNEKFSVEISDDLSGIDIEKLKLIWSIYEDGTLNKEDITNWKDMDTTYSDSKLTGNPKSIDYSEFGDQFLYIMCTVEDNAGNYVELMTNVELIDRETVAKTWNITVASSVDTDDDDVYYVGKTVEITAKEDTGQTGLVAKIMIQSTSQSYTLELLSSDIDYIQATNTYTYEWNTTDLNPADDYVVNITLEDVSAGISKSEILIITLEETFVDFELKDLKFMVGAEEITTAREGDKIDIVVTLLIDGEYNGPTTVEFFKDKPSADNNAFAHEEISNLGTTRTVILNWTIPEGFKGKQTIYVVVDRDDLVTETSENNNEVNKDIEITKGPSGPSGDDDGIPIYLIIIPIGAVAAVGGIFLYIKSREDYEYEDEED